MQDVRISLNPAVSRDPWIESRHRFTAPAADDDITRVNDGMPEGARLDSPTSRSLYSDSLTADTTRTNIPDDHGPR